LFGISSLPHMAFSLVGSTRVHTRGIVPSPLIPHSFLDSSSVFTWPCMFYSRSLVTCLQSC
jgi:hypothetical protein